MADHITRYDLMPIPPVEKQTRWFEAGAVRIGVEYRLLTDAIAAANDTEFGLAAYLFTENVSRLFRVSEALEYGIVAANTGIFSSEVGPFGGVKNSGLGREGSKYGIDEFLEIKFVCVGI